MSSQGSTSGLEVVKSFVEEDAGKSKLDLEGRNFDRTWLKKSWPDEPMTMRKLPPALAVLKVKTSIQRMW